MSRNVLGTVRFVLAMMMAMVCALAGSGAVAQELIGVSVDGQMDREVVRLQLSVPLSSSPQGFAMQEPPRISLDLPGVTSRMARDAIAGNGNVNGINVIGESGRTRAVLNLKRAASYSLQEQGSSLLVALGTDDGEPSDVAGAAVVRHIDFRRGEGGGGRIIVELPSQQVAVDLRQEGQSLVAVLPGLQLAEGLSRRMNVTDFGTPVRAITASDMGGRVRLSVDAQGDWVHTAYQSGNEFVIDVQQRPAEADRARPGQGYSGERMTLNFQSIDVRQLLQVIADFTGLNIIASDSVTGTLTLRLKDVPWDQALDIILQARGLGMRRSDSVLWIAPKDELLAKEKAELEARAALRDLEPLVTRAFQLNYTKAAEIAAQLTSSSGAGSGASGAAASLSGTRLLSPRGSVVAEPRTNQIFVSDIPSKIADIQSLLARLDKAMRQVLIEARIVVAEDTFSRELGVRLGGGAVGNRTAIGSSYVSGSPGITNGDFINLPGSSSVGTAVPSLALSLFNSSATRFLNLELQALEEEGKGKVVSSPRVMTADQVKALIEQGTEVPYQEATSSGATSVSFRKANLKLEVTPQITPEGNVILDLDVNKDTLGQETTNGYAINTKHVKTQALIENGGTIVIGGIFELEENESVRKVPLLGDIPGIGNLFKSRSRSTSKTELLIFITPRILDEQMARR